MSFNSSPSTKSGAKSKRTSKNTSNQSDSKRKKTTQKTLGVAWGSNSRSSSRSTFQSSPFSDFGSYMVVKNQKLRDQFDAEASNSINRDSNSRTPIFRGVSIFVDGFTIPSSQELRGYMVKHGGRFENYFSRLRVTHIICSNLPDSKIKNFRAFSRGLPVVKPGWISDCVAANKLLSWVPYQLDQISSEANNQPKLLDFLASKSSSTLTDSLCNNSGQSVSETKDPSLKGGTSKEVCEILEDSVACTGQWDQGLLENVIEDSINSVEECIGEKLVEAGDVSTSEYNSTGNLDQGTPSQPGAAISISNVERSSVLATLGAGEQHRSTSVDPNFVENYFKNSRLHFIGTWRNRYRKRFPSSRHLTSGGDACTLRAVIHVDMDCFFVAVVIRNRPELQDKPVAVCHSDNPRGTSEISSANYPARNYGVKAGVFVRDAKALCPELMIVPYDFEAYEEVADQFYHILHKHSTRVQAVSCDEAFLDVLDSEVEDPQLLASIIRKEIFEATQCTASAGISGNLLLARLATKAAKPNGQFYIAPDMVDDYLRELPIKALPGIGRVLEEKLKRKQVQTCGQLWMLSKDSLQRDFGAKTGDMLWNYSRGVDTRLVGIIQESKSIGAEVNWGVRFNDPKDCQLFLTKLCKEVSLRLQGGAVQGRNFTLKVKKRKNYAGEPVKYMGCGDCDNLSHSITVPLATDDVEVIQRITKQLFGLFHIDVKDIRGVGLQVSKLERLENAKQGNEKHSMRSWLVSASKNSLAIENSNQESGKQSIHERHGDMGIDPSRLLNHIGTSSTNAETPSNQDSALPPLADLDLGVVESLPPDMFSEINAMYNGKLTYLISKRKGKRVEVINSPSRISPETKQAEINDKMCYSPDKARASDSRRQDKVDPFSEVEPSDVAISKNLMPISLSQVDNSVLEQLPEELRIDILDKLPEHRVAEKVLDPTSASKKNEKLSPDCPGNVSVPINSTSEELCVGNPPSWVKKFLESNCSVLKLFSDMYYKSGSTGRLSSILQTTISESHVLIDSVDDGCNNGISCMCDLLKQYIKLVLDSDLEEIYVCYLILKRLSRKFNFFFQVHEIILPHLQASVGECYGGSLCIFNTKD